MSGALLLGLLLAQAVQVDPPEAAQLARIRKALAESPVMNVPLTPDREGVVFRVTVHARQSDGPPLWSDWTAVPSYIRPSYPLYHNEFLLMTTPGDFRAGTMYPTMFSVPVTPIVEWLAKQIAMAHRKSQEAHARDEVRKALEDVLACRADPARPGC